MKTKKPRSRARRAGTGVLTTAMLAGTSIFVAAEPAAAAPAGKNFGPIIDAYQSYDPMASCLPFVEQPGVKDFRSLVLAAYPGTGDSGIWRPCGQGDDSEHKEGRAWDWGGVSAFNSGDRQKVDDLLNWLFATDKYGNKHALARRFGIQYIIWDKKIWGAYKADEGWRNYPCSGVTKCHQDHVHFSFGWGGARRQTSWWAGGSFGKQTVGYYQAAGNNWRMTNTNAAGAATDYSFSYGTTTSKVVTGDWNKDGKTTPGYYERSDGTWHLRNTNSGGGDDITFHYPGGAMIPIAGDWNNDGKTTVGFYDPTTSNWHLRNSLTSGGDDIVFHFGSSGNITPVVGDWNNDGKTTIGYYNKDNGTWNLRNSLSDGSPDVSFTWAHSGTPIAGDWNADGKTTVGFYWPNTGQYMLKDSLSSGSSDYNFSFGPGEGATPIVGDWNNS